LDAHAEAEGLTSLPVPFALNQDPDPLRLGPSDDAEWAAWTARWLVGRGADVTRDDVRAAWRSLAKADPPVRGRISVLSALDALRRGAEPPATGHDNPHHFDDAAAVRAVGIGAVTDDPNRAAEIAGWDAEVTNGDDGVASARAVAAAVAAAVSGESGPAIIDVVLAYLPSNTLAGRTVRRQLEVSEAAPSVMDAAARLDDALDTVYSYGVAAAETVAVAVALTATATRTGSSPGDAVAAAACLPRLADSAPALTGALMGALGGYDALPQAWAERSRGLVGCCLPALAGCDLVDLADRASAAGSRGGSGDSRGVSHRGFANKEGENT
jgi:ADP-ribosylglycohydrolase